LFMEECILLSHGGGGEETQSLISNLILSYFDNPYLSRLEDATPLELSSPWLAVTTDSFTVKPIFFPGGNIGKLSVCGTLNDLLVMGAKPRYLTLALVLEEGLSISTLKKVLESIKEEAEKNEVLVVAGDTKVMPKGMLDEMIINTTGIGEIIKPGLSCQNLREGDLILATGPLGDHGVAILSRRQGFEFDVPVESDCASLKEPLLALFSADVELHALRDPTRGGLAGVLYEWAMASQVEILVREVDIPVRDEVKTFCAILGLEPYHLPSEGRAIIVLPEPELDKALSILKKYPLTSESKVIGVVKKKTPRPRVLIETVLGTTRIMDTLVGEMLPRIC
jgi:hydrogenase expression/formation protein HypE